MSKRYGHEAQGLATYRNDKRMVRGSHVSRGVRRFSLLSAVTTCAVLGGTIAVAQASDGTLRQTLNHFAPKIANDESAVKDGLNGYPQGKGRPLTSALSHEVSDLHALKSKLSNESASSPSGAEARTDLIKGLGLIASAYAVLRKDVVAAQGAPVPAAQVTAAVNTDKEGRKKLLAGLKLLSAQPKPNPTPAPTPTPTPTPAPTPTPTGCYPLASSGNCYEPGEYCPNADHGMTGIAGDGKSIICENNNGWRWEPQ